MRTDYYDEDGLPCEYDDYDLQNIYSSIYYDEYPEEVEL